MTTVKRSAGTGGAGEGAAVGAKPAPPSKRPALAPPTTPTSKVPAAAKKARRPKGSRGGAGFLRFFAGIDTDPAKGGTLACHVFA
ncbi:unnamed protein product [Pararhodospirillum photometricum DSM 122]|uniref:Uncharacterized protein n=1 Tax=Pararhodospirillum photometricum DSM 122 TaxID=1150469 RepID=H6SNU2_PARPM|nr:unnamed protein product [Pararhodospirillum photometricum DSM 122]